MTILNPEKGLYNGETYWKKGYTELFTPNNGLIKVFKLIELEPFRAENQIVIFINKSKKTKKSLKISDLVLFVGPRSEISNPDDSIRIMTNEFRHDFLEEDVEAINDTRKENIYCENKRKYRF